MNLSELKELREKANAAHQAAGYAYGIAMAHPTGEHITIMKAARKASNELAREYKKADKAFYAEMNAREADARNEKMDLSNVGAY
jgi:hypothetical protein